MKRVNISWNVVDVLSMGCLCEVCVLSMWCVVYILFRSCPCQVYVLSVCVLSMCCLCVIAFSLVLVFSLAKNNQWLVKHWGVFNATVLMCNSLYVYFRTELYLIKPCSSSVCSRSSSHEVVKWTIETLPKQNQ